MKKTWDDVWREGESLNIFGRRLRREQAKAIKKFLPKNVKNVLDVGCGLGRTMDVFMECGLDVVGIDVSPTSIKICKSKGLNVFLMDGSKTDFENRSFDLVFSDGLLEHFEDFEPFVKEWCRIADRYVMLTQPNHFSVLGRILKSLNRHTVKEYSYRIIDFERVFKKNNFKLLKRGSYNFNEQWVLLFERI
ncbi:MAG: hypothetical protein DRP11_02845 [Candidatus Aenigmatarchaeota archaeon]|nr:MAG: hypothetical protein DRP11_02845 [Candidatus Aenigmarchaeota archaeon]